MTNRVKVGLCGEDSVLTNSPTAPETKIQYGGHETLVSLNATFFWGSDAKSSGKGSNPWSSMGTMPFQRSMSHSVRFLQGITIHRRAKFVDRPVTAKDRTMTRCWPTQIFKIPNIIVVHPDDFKLTCGQQKKTQHSKLSISETSPSKTHHFWLRMTTFTANHYQQLPKTRNAVVVVQQR